MFQKKMKDKKNQEEIVQGFQVYNYIFKYFYE